MRRICSFETALTFAAEHECDGSVTHRDDYLFSEV